LTDPDRQMEAWAIDAANVDVSHLPQIPFCREAVRVFLNARLGGLERVLVAPKGYGKTLYLKYKSHLIRQTYRNSIAIFPDSFTDIEFLKLSLERKEMIQDVARLTIDNWSLLWQFVLICKGVQLVGAEITGDDYLSSLLRYPTEPVGDILTAVIRDQDNMGANTSLRLKHVRRLFQEAGRDAVIFVDNADEMFVGLENHERHKEKLRQEVPTELQEQQRRLDAAISAEVSRESPSMWKAAQVGLLLAVREIERSARRLTVYTSLRAEAVYTAQHPDVLQARTYAIPIRYSEEDLKEIFAWHINLMADSDLVAPRDSHSIDGLMGPEGIKHRYVRVDGEPKLELPFELVLRHTTFSPRDLVTIGGKIKSLSAAERTGPKRSELIRQAVDAAVVELMVYFRQNAIPLWNEEWESSLSKLSTSVLIHADIERLGSVASKLYSYGLLGVARPTGTLREYTQSFLTQWDASYAASKLPVPRADFYFLHPWIFDSVKVQNPDFKGDDANIVGTGCRFNLAARLQVTLGCDVNDHPAVWCNSEMDSPAAQSKMATFPMGVIFLFCAILACRNKESNRIEWEDVVRARDEFDERFPQCRRAPMLRPLHNSEQRSHIRSSLKNFPSLRDHVSQMQGSIKIVSAAGDSPAYLELDFLDPHAIVVQW